MINKEIIKQELKDYWIDESIPFCLLERGMEYRIQRSYIKFFTNELPALNKKEENNKTRKEENNKTRVEIISCGEPIKLVKPTNINDLVVGIIKNTIEKPRKYRWARDWHIFDIAQDYATEDVIFWTVRGRFDNEKMEELKKLFDKKPNN